MKHRTGAHSPMRRRTPFSAFGVMMNAIDGRITATFLIALAGLALTSLSAGAQVTCFGDPTCVQPVTGYPIGQPGTPNIEVVSHLPLPGVPFSHTDIEIEQDMARPFVYIAQRYGASGFYALSIEDPEKPKVLYRWIIDNPDLHLGAGCVDIKYAKADGRYYVILSCQFGEGPTPIWGLFCSTSRICRTGPRCEKSPNYDFPTCPAVSTTSSLTATPTGGPCWWRPRSRRTPSSTTSHNWRGG